MLQTPYLNELPQPKKIETEYTVHYIAKNEIGISGCFHLAKSTWPRIQNC